MMDNGVSRLLELQFSGAEENGIFYKTSRIPTDAPQISINTLPVLTSAMVPLKCYPTVWYNTNPAVGRRNVLERLRWNRVAWYGRAYTRTSGLRANYSKIYISPNLKHRSIALRELESSSCNLVLYLTPSGWGTCLVELFVTAKCSTCTVHRHDKLLHSA